MDRESGARSDAPRTVEARWATPGSSVPPSDPHQLADLRAQHLLDALAHEAAGTAHDINLVLEAGLVVAGGLLEECAANDPRREALEAVVSALRRSGQLSAGLVEPIGGTALRPEVVALRKLAREVTQVVHRTAPPAVTVELQCRAGLTQVWVDPARIFPALLAVCQNAIEAMPLGGRLRVAVMPIPAKNGAPSKVGIVVADDGYGMEQATLDRACDPYFSTKRQHVGLGLSRVHRAVADARGELRIESCVGKGTKVSMIFPAAEAPQEEAPKPLSGRRVLLVDSEPGAVTTAAQLLTELGCQVVAVTSGREALRRFESDPSLFDLVMLDPGCAEMSGMMFLSRVLNVRPDLRVMLVSSSGHVSMPGSVLSHPRVAMIRKPFDVKRTEDTLLKLFAGE